MPSCPALGVILLVRRCINPLRFMLARAALKRRRWAYEQVEKHPARIYGAVYLVIVS